MPTECVDLIAVRNKPDLRITLKMDAGGVLEFVEGVLLDFAPFAPAVPMILVRLNRNPKTFGLAVGA